MPRYEAFILKGWEEQGITRVVVARTRDAAWVEAGVFLVDAFCLGVKDAFLTEASAVDWPGVLNRMLPADERVALHPACARKFVEGAVAYTEALGIAPHRDYKKARRAFGSVSASDCPETFTYGQNGKPLFVAGPNDDAARIDRVMRVLTAKLGPDGFHYILPVDPEPSDEEVESDEAGLNASLRMLFLDLGREADRHVLGGLCAAACVGQPDVLPEALIPVLWDSPPASWTENDRTRLGSLITEYWNQTEDRLDFAEEAGRPEDIPHFVDEPWQNDSEVGIVARLWCRGFMRGVAAWPSAWADLHQRKDLVPHFGAIAAIEGEPSATGAGAPSPASDLARTIGVAVLTIRAGLPPSTDDEAPASLG